MRKLIMHGSLLCLLLMAAMPLRAEGLDQPRIVVNGIANISVPPDVAILTLTVTRDAQSARAALDENTAAMAKVMQSMQDGGIAKKDLQTSNFSIQPRYAHPPTKANGERPPARIAGYVVRNTLTVRVRDISQVGKLLDRSVSLGVNEGGNIAFTNDDLSEALTRARSAAVANAMAKARTLAKGAGVRLGEVLEITEYSANPRPMPMAHAQASRVLEDVVVAAGENAYSVTVNVTLAIEQ